MQGVTSPAGNKLTELFSRTHKFNAGIGATSTENSLQAMLVNALLHWLLSIVYLSALG